MLTRKTKGTFMPADDEHHSESETTFLSVLNFPFRSSGSTSDLWISQVDELSAQLQRQYPSRPVRARLPGAFNPSISSALQLC